MGKGKPADIHTFLQDLIGELCRLSPSNENLSCINQRFCTASLRCIIADGPMRSYLKRTKGHSGYWCCDRCIQKGEMVNRAVLLRNINAPMRTDADFLTYHVNDYSIDEHLKDPNDLSPFLDINFPMVSGFVIDPMHTVVEGAFGRRLEGFILVPGEGKLSNAKIDEANQRIKYFHLCRPYGFDRYVDKLEKCKNYKIHVKRNILYYLLFPLFNGILDENKLEHIMLLQYGMMLLGSFKRKPVPRNRLLEAKKTFDRYSMELTERDIPCRFVSHQVSHVWQDSAYFQCGIETLSAFPFESFHNFFRRCIRSGNLQAEQIRNRCVEKSKYQLPTASCGTIIESKVQLMLEARKNNNKVLKLCNKGDRWPKKIFFNDFVLSNRFPNNIFLDNQKSAFVCVDIVNCGLEVVNIVSRKFLSLENAHRQPYLSSDHNIFSPHNLSTQTFGILPSQVFAKMMALPLNPTPPISLENHQLQWYLVPLLHTCENSC